MEHHLADTKLHVFVLVQCHQFVDRNKCSKHIQENVSHDTVLMTMHYATPHINFWGVLHIFVNLMWPFLSTDATVVPVYMAMHMEGCLIREHHLP
jgi:hypothetical protein